MKIILRTTQIVFGMLLATMLISGCAKSITKGSTKLKIPFMEPKYRSDKDYFRATAQSKSPDLMMAKEMATNNARRELAAQIEITVKNVFDEYKKQRQIGNEMEFDRKTESMLRTVIDETLYGSTIIGEEVFQDKEGKYDYYVAVEVPRVPVINNFDSKISKDEALRQDYDKAKFQEIFEQEMENLRQQQQGG